MFELVECMSPIPVPALPRAGRGDRNGYKVVKTNLLMSQFLATLMSELNSPAGTSAMERAGGAPAALRPRTLVTMIRRRFHPAQGPAGR
jgi:hypothetical protein